MPERKRRNILVLLPNWIGDAVMATPTLRALRRAHPQARITHLGAPGSLDALAPNDWANDVLADTSRRPPRLANFCRIAATLRHRRYDLALLLPNSFCSAALARAGGVRRIVGYDRDGRGWMLSDKLAPPRDEDGDYLPVSAVDYYLRLAQLVGVGPDASPRIELFASDEDADRADAELDAAGARPGRPIVMLNPGAAFGPSKMWSSEGFAAVGDSLIDRWGAQVIVNASPSERAIAAKVCEAMAREPILSFAERDNTLGLLKGLLRRCELLITNDTGARHIGAALGVGIVTLFGSTDPRWADIHYERERAVRLDVDCSPCQRKMCTQPAGPLYHQCMSGITAEMVLSAAAELLAVPRAAGVAR